MEEIILGVVIFGFFISIALFPSWWMRLGRKDKKNGFGRRKVYNWKKD